MNTSPLALLLALGAVALVFIGLSIVAPRRVILAPDGTRRFEPSDLEKFLAPLAARFARLRGRSLKRVAQELEWARIDYFSPELWVLLPIFTGFGVGLVVLTLLAQAGMNPAMSGIAGFIGAFIGFMYPQVYLSRRLNARQRAIRDDVIPFIAQFARTAAVAKDITTTFEIMNNLAIAEQAQYEARLKMAPHLRSRLKRLQVQRPYSSDLWLGLQIMMRHAAQGLYRANADYDHPDPLIAFAIFSDDPDIGRFIDKLRSARANNRNVGPEQLDIEVRNLHLARIQEVRRSFAKLVAEATFFLVIFNMPLLLIAALAPVIGPLFSAFGGA